MASKTGVRFLLSFFLCFLSRRSLGSEFRRLSSCNISEAEGLQMDETTCLRLNICIDTKAARLKN